MPQHIYGLTFFDSLGGKNKSKKPKVRTKPQSKFALLFSITSLIMYQMETITMLLVNNHANIKS